jgi:tetratricopeptide (TPR) repeat protein
MDNPQAKTELKYQAFISYSHRDEAWARWLHKALETYRIPRRLVGLSTATGVIPRRLTPIFRDRDELPSATDLSAKVEEALRQSTNLIVICSPRATASRWVGEEILTFKRLGRADRIFCLIVDGEPNATDIPGREAEECFPRALRFRVDAAGKLTLVPTEPIAADARSGKDGKNTAKLRLIAGLIGVGFDDLRQREQQRRVRQLAAITASASVVMVVTIALAINAAIARRVAEHREKQAESLIGFMLGDLQKKLETVNRLDILNDVADKAMDYFADSRDAEATNDSLAEYAQALQKIGRVREEQGKLDAANEAFNQSLRLMQRLVASDPSNPAWKIALADSYSWLGMVAWDRGDLGEANRQFRATIPLVTRVIAEHPENQDWAKRLAGLHNNIGHVQQARGEFVSAGQEYRTVLSLNEKMIANAAEGSAESHRARMKMALAYGDLGVVAYAMGSVGEAENNRRRSLAIWLDLARESPQDMSVQEYLAEAYFNHAESLSAQGAVVDAAAALENALTISKRRLAEDPTSKDAQGAVAAYSRALAKRRLLDGELAKAQALCGTAVSMYKSLAAAQFEELRWQRGIAAARLVNAWISLERKDPAAAREDAEAAFAILAALTRAHPDNDVLDPSFADAEILLGRLAAGDAGSAPEAHWHAAVQVLSRGARHVRDPEFLSRRAEALCLLGDVQQGKTLIAELNDLGYRDDQFLKQTFASPCHQSGLIASRE